MLKITWFNLQIKILVLKLYWSFIFWLFIFFRVYPLPIHHHYKFLPEQERYSSHRALNITVFLWDMQSYWIWIAGSVSKTRIFMEHETYFVISEMCYTYILIEWWLYIHSHRVVVIPDCPCLTVSLWTYTTLSCVDNICFTFWCNSFIFGMVSFYVRSMHIFLWFPKWTRSQGVMALFPTFKCCIPFVCSVYLLCFTGNRSVIFW